MTGDTPVTMADGSYKCLDKIAIGDRVLAYKDGRVVVGRVSNWAPQGEDDLLEIRTGSNRVRCNTRHPFLTTKGWIQASDLRTGDKLIVNSRVSGWTNRLSTTSAWLLGFMFGDGWVTVRDTVQKGRGQYVAQSGEKRVYTEAIYPRRGYATHVAFSNNEVLNERILQAFEDVFAVRPKFYSKQRCARTDIARIGRWFQEHGLVGKASTKRVPSWVFGEIEENRLEFLRAFMYRTPTGRGWIGASRFGAGPDKKFVDRQAASPSSWKTPFIATVMAW
jgi:intein/homing endonuclease